MPASTGAEKAVDHLVHLDHGYTPKKRFRSVPIFNPVTSPMEYRPWAVRTKKGPRGESPRPDAGLPDEASAGHDGFTCRFVVLGHLFPVDNVPESAHIVRATVLVFEVIGVLPHVEPEQRRVPVHERAVLIRR